MTDTHTGNDADKASPRIEIVSEGRGGSIVYREGEQHINFSYELAMPPAIALVFGPPSRPWDRNFPWAAGRCTEIYEFVGAETVRQQAAGGSFTIDFDNNMMEILRAAR